VHPEVVQSTADLHHQIADALLPQAEPVFDDATALHTAVHVLDPQPAVVQDLIGSCLLPCQLLAADFLVGLRIFTWGSVNARKPRACNSQLPAGKG
jgi:hypothetical protein